MEEKQGVLFPDYESPTTNDGATLRDSAIAQVAANADEDWLARAWAAIQQVCRTCREFTADDVWALVEKPREPRALGALLRRATKEGLIDRTDRTKFSERPECHRRPVRVWISLVAHLSLKGDVNGTQGHDQQGYAPDSRGLPSERETDPTTERAVLDAH